MSDVEKTVVRHLQAWVTFVPGSSHKRFVLHLNPETSQLSDRGRNYLAYIAHRYRRQWTATDEEFEWIVAWNTWSSGHKPLVANHEAQATEGDMAEHYTRNTLTATAWCNKCGRHTEHRIDDGRRGPCLDPNHPAPLVKAKIPKLELPEDKQGDLFGEKKS
jgi:hypothetical protein